MPLGVPVLGENDMFESLSEPVDEGDDLVAAADGKRTADSVNCMAEVVLQVDDEERVGSLGSNRHSYLLLPAVF